MTETHEQRVERLARAIWEHEASLNSFFEPIQWDDAHEECREKIREGIRAIIASDREAGYVTVPREPSEAMRHAGGMVLDPGARMEGPNAASRQKAARVYEAAIAAHEQEE